MDIARRTTTSGTSDVVQRTERQASSFTKHTQLSVVVVRRVTELSEISQGWLDSRVVSLLDSSAVGPGFKSQPRRCRVTVLGKLFTPICLCSSSSKIGSSPLEGCGGNCRPGKVTAAYRRVYDSCHLQADCQEPGSAPKPYAR